MGSDLLHICWTACTIAVVFTGVCMAGQGHQCQTDRRGPYTDGIYGLQRQLESAMRVYTTLLGKGNANVYNIMWKASCKCMHDFGCVSQSTVIFS